MTRSAAAAGEPRPLPPGAMVVLALGALDFGLEQSIILPALPDLADHYGASLIGVAWLATAFLVASIVAVPLAGRLGDILGKRRVLLFSLTAFALGSAICAVAGSIGIAIAGRAVQGLGAALTPLTLGLARDTVPARQLPRVVGAVVGAANVGGGVGFLLSGVIVDLLGPAAIFWFLLGLALALLVGVALLVPESPVRTRVPLDVGGAVLLSGGLAALLLAISKGSAWGWASAEILLLFGGAAVLLAAFVLVERAVAHPLVDLRLVTRPPLANANVCSFAFGLAFFLAIFIVPQIAGTPDGDGGLGLTTTAVGLLLVPTSLAGLLGGWLGGRNVDRLGPRALVAVGALWGVAGYALLAVEHGTAAALATGSAMLGMAWGLILTGIYPVILRSASTDTTGVAVAVSVVFRNTAVSIGVTVAFVIIAESGPDDGYRWALLLGAAGSLAALFAARLLPGPRAPGRA